MICTPILDTQYWGYISKPKSRSCRTKIRCGSFCFLSAAFPARADSSVPPYSAPAEGRFCPSHLWPGFPGNGRSFCRKVVLCPGKSTGRLLRPFIPPFLTDFTMFFAKKALQMNFKNILYNYRFNFFTQIVSYRFVWGSRICAFALLLPYDRSLEPAGAAPLHQIKYRRKVMHHA